LRSTLAGTPPTIVYGSTSPVTTDPAPTIAPSPTRTPGRISARIPIHERRSRWIGARAALKPGPSGMWVGGLWGCREERCSSGDAYSGGDGAPGPGVGEAAFPEGAASPERHPPAEP